MRIQTLLFSNYFTVFWEFNPETNKYCVFAIFKTRSLTIYRSGKLVFWRILIYYLQLRISAKLGHCRKDQPSPQGGILHCLVGEGRKICL